MWLPNNKHYAVENFSTTVTGDYTYSNFDAQNQIGGVIGLRNIATGLNVTVPAGEPWPSMTWNTGHDFDMLWSASSGDFITTGGAPTQNLSYGTISLINDQAIYSTGAYNFDTGVLFETEFLVNRLTGVTTGSTNNNLYGLFFQHTGSTNQGFETVTLQLKPNPGFVIGRDTAHETFVPATGLGSQVVGFRYGIRGTTGHFVTTDGYSVYMTGMTYKAPVSMTGLNYTGLNSGETGSTVLIGDLTPMFTGAQGDATSRIEVGKLYQKSPVFDIAGDFIEDTLYSTGQQTFTTTAFKPNIRPELWQKAYYKLVGNEAGNTIIRALTTNDGTTFTTGATSVTHATTGLFSLDLSSINITDPANAQVKYEIAQQSSDGTVAPVQVDYITTVFSSENSSNFLYLDPEAGSAVGEYPVLISVDPNSRSHVVAPTTTGSVLFHAALTGTVTETGFVDFISLQTGNTEDTGNLLTNIFGQSGKAFRTYTGLVNSLTGIFESFPGVVNLQQGVQYAVVQGGPNTLLASKNIQYLFPTGAAPSGFSGVSTGAYTSTIGDQLTAYDYPGAGVSPSNILDVTTMTHSESGKVMTYAAQRYRGTAGHGFLTPKLGTATSGLSDNYMLIEAIVQVSKGGVAFSVDEETVDYTLDPTYSSYRYGTPQRVYTVIPMPTGDVKVRAYGVSDELSPTDAGDSEFMIADMSVYGFNNNSITFTGNPVTHSVATTSASYHDAWVKIDGHTRKTGRFDSYIVRHTGADFDMILGLDSHGRPFIDYTGGGVEQYATGLFGIKPDGWHHLAWQNNGLYSIYIDGELALHTPVTAGTVPNTGDVLLGGGFVGAMSHVRMFGKSFNPTEVGVNHAFSAPLKFQTSYQLPTGQAEMLYRFDQGTLWDLSKSGTYGFTGMSIVPEHKHARTWTERNGEGAFGEGIEFGGQAGGASGAVDATTTSSQGWVGMWVAAVGGDSAAAPRVFQIGDAKLDLSEAKYPRWIYSGNTFTSTTDITERFGYGWLTIEHRINGVNTDIVGNWSTGQTTATQLFSGQMTGNTFELTGQLYFGHDSDVAADRTSIFMDEFGVYTGSFPTGHTGNYLDTNYNKGAPDETVYLDDIALTGTRVSHVGVYDKEIIMPAQTSFDLTGSSIRISVDTLAGNKVLTPNFMYLGVRKIVLDTGSFGQFAEVRDKLCKTKSPFRIGRQVPEDGVNLAFMTAPDFSVQNNLSIVDAAGAISENYVAALKAYENMPIFTDTEVTGTTNIFKYTGAIDTDDVLLSTYVMQRKNIEFAAPLFYKYPLGRGALFTYQVGATGDTLTAADVDLIRENIRITDQDGKDVPVTEFPWDIRASKQREDSASLPTNVYNVEVLSRDRFIPNRSLFIEFNAANPLKDYAQVKGWRECLNPEPIYRHVGKDSSVQESFSTVDSIRFNDLSTSRFNAGPIVIVNQLTGTWAPYIHASLIHDDDYII